MAMFFRLEQSDGPGTLFGLIIRNLNADSKVLLLFGWIVGFGLADGFVLAPKHIDNRILPTILN